MVGVVEVSVWMDEPRFSEMGFGLSSMGFP